MAEAFKKLYQGTAPTAIATAYTVPAGRSAVIKLLKLQNIGSVPSTIQVNHDGTGTGSLVLPVYTLQPGEMVVMDDTWFMEDSDTLATLASVASTILVTVYGVELY